MMESLWSNPLFGISSLPPSHHDPSLSCYSVDHRLLEADRDFL
mgnify:CR=1 FL=1